MLFGDGKIIFGKKSEPKILRVHEAKVLNTNQKQNKVSN